MPDAISIAIALVLLAAANGTPVLAKKLLGDRYGMPLDAGIVLPDGAPLFGASKTVRGIVLSMLCTAPVAAVAGIGWTTGAGFAAASMAGDLLSSFTKRRLRLKVHAQCLGLDQIPEALLPLLVFRGALGLSGLDVAIAVAAFVVLELGLSRVLFRLGIRDRPW